MKGLLAFFWSVSIVTVIPGLLFFFSAAAIFSNPEAIKEKVVPGTYEPALNWLYSEMNPDPDGGVLLDGRLRTAFPYEDYSAVVGAGIDSFSDADFVNLRVDLTPVKEELTRRAPAIIQRLPACAEVERVDRFRFCVPEGHESQIQSSFLAAIDKELPGELALTVKEDQQGLVQWLIRAPSLIRISFFGALLVAVSVLALILRDLRRLLKWTGIVLIIISTIGGLILFSFTFLPALVISQQAFSFHIIRLIEALLLPVIGYYKSAVFMFGIVGLLCIASFFLLRRQSNESA